MSLNPEIYIEGDSIKIGQLIKKLGHISTGGAIKYFLENNKVLINNKKVLGRSTKVFINDVVWINDDVYVVKKNTGS